MQQLLLTSVIALVQLVVAVVTFRAGERRARRRSEALIVSTAPSVRVSAFAASWNTITVTIDNAERYGLVVDLGDESHTVDPGATSFNCTFPNLAIKDSKEVSVVIHDMRGFLRILRVAKLTVSGTLQEPIGTVTLTTVSHELDLDLY